VYAQVRIDYANVVEVNGAVVLREVAIEFRVFTSAIAYPNAGDHKVSDTIALLEHLKCRVLSDIGIRVGTQDGLLVMAASLRLDALKAEARRNAQLFRDVENVLSKQRLVVSRKVIFCSLKVVRMEKAKCRLVPLRPHALPSIGKPAVKPRTENQCSGRAHRGVVVDEPQLPAIVGELVGKEVSGTANVGTVDTVEVAKRVS